MTGHSLGGNIATRTAHNRDLPAHVFNPGAEPSDAILNMPRVGAFEDPRICAHCIVHDVASAFIAWGSLVDVFRYRHHEKFGTHALKVFLHPT